ncbi:hypothetical protein [Streptomyces hilarionis]|uniref:hypothetical protein n=1 Tax=Streptomyces hilarionis TaxID=2839954 RepID=UPI00211AA118|nr:hypothetical protein [Streptomyces hilarionis]MCQ9133115.1 hypothetical protein [Streptomyces hilarionis]
MACPKGRTGRTPAGPRAAAALLALALALPVAGCDRGGSGSSDGPDKPKGNAGAWHIDYRSPEPDAELNGLTAVSADEAWAVGSIGKPDHRNRSLLLHRVGGRWSPVQPPAELRRDPQLQAAASGPHDVWIHHQDPAPLPPTEATADRRYRPLPDGADGPDGPSPLPVMRWDGERWRRIPVPFPITTLRVVSPRRAWAVDDHGALWGWDGRTWKRTGLPLWVGALDASSPDDVWAVGTRLTTDPPNQVAALHYDGRRWRQTRLPEYRFARDRVLPGETSTLGYVRALAADDVWALGSHTWEPEDETATDPPFEHFFLHWDGRRWQRAPHPPAAAHSAAVQPLASDGAGGLVLGAWLRRTSAGRYLGIDAPPGVEGWTETKVKPSERQWLSLSGLALAPGTHTLFGAGALLSHEGSTDRDSRAVVVSYRPTAP